MNFVASRYMSLLQGDACEARRLGDDYVCKKIFLHPFVERVAAICCTKYGAGHRQFFVVGIQFAPSDYSGRDLCSGRINGLWLVRNTSFP